MKLGTSFGLGVMVLLSASAARADCSKDTDCKRDRICTQGKCVSPGAKPAPAARAPEVTLVELEGRSGVAKVGGKQCGTPCKLMLAPGTYVVTLDGKPMPSVRVADAALQVDFRPSGLGEIGKGIAFLCVGGLAMAVGGGFAGIYRPSISNLDFDLFVGLFVVGLGAVILGSVVTVTGIIDLSGPKMVVRRSADALPSQRRQFAVVPWLAPLSAPTERSTLGPAGAIAGVSVGF